MGAIITKYDFLDPRRLIIEVFRCLGRSNPCFMSDMFKVKESVYDNYEKIQYVNCAKF